MTHSNLNSVSVRCLSQTRWCLTLWLAATFICGWCALANSYNVPK